MTHVNAARCGAALSVTVTLVLGASGQASAAPAVRARGAAAVLQAARRSGPRVRCVASSHRYDARAARMAHDIAAQLSGRVSTVGLKEVDSQTGITCTYHADWHFYAASVIKATILAALLRMAQDQRRSLTASERHRAWLMITQSDNDAATALWNEVGMRRMQHFLDLAKMGQTRLADAWGLSLLTAHDEVLLLRLLSRRNPVLSLASRRYAGYLMSHVTATQRWGVPTGAPASVRVHVKNGWLPYPVSRNWEINSIGYFTARQPHRVYIIAMLTHANPTMGYGIETIEDAAHAINRALNPRQPGVIGEAVPNPTWGKPDETVPPAGRR